MSPFDGSLHRSGYDITAISEAVGLSPVPTRFLLAAAECPFASV
jgi:hypothetical protein